MKKKVNGAGTKLDHTEKLKSCKTLLKTISEVIIFLKDTKCGDILPQSISEVLKLILKDTQCGDILRRPDLFLKDTECGDILPWS